MMTGLRPALKICFVQMLVLCGEAVVGVVAYAMCFGLCSMFNNAHASVAGANPARGGTTARLQETPTRAKWTIYEQHPEM